MALVYAIFFIVFVTTAVESTSFNISSDLFATLEIVDSNSTFQKLYPEAEIIPFSDGGAKAVGILTHTLGNKTPWDRIIGRGGRNIQFPSPQNFRLTLTYPAKSMSVGSVVTYVEIKVLQTSNSGQAYVTAGGIGKRYITIVVEAFSTKRFDYTASLYNSASQLQALGLMVPMVSLLFLFGSISSFLN